MSDTLPITSRFFQPGDEKQIEPLFRQVFQQEQSYAEWKWKFLNSPYQKKFIHLHFDPTGELIGQFAASVAPLNFLGRKEWGAQSVDSAIKTEYRSHGLFVQSLVTSMEKMREEGISVLYGFPNRLSLPIVLFKIGVSFHFELKHFFLSPNEEYLDHLYRQLLVHSTHDAAHARILSGFTLAGSVDAVNALWKSVAPHEICSLWKDHEYLQWRYAEHPTKKYRITAFGTEHHLEALIVWQQKGSQAYVSEFLVRRKDIVAGRFALVEFLSLLKNEQIGTYVFACGGDRFQEQVHDEIKWSSSKELSFASVSLRQDIAHIVNQPQNWTVVAGDSDVD